MPRWRGLGDATDVSDDAARRACIAVFMGHIIYDAIASEMACEILGVNRTGAIH